MRRLARLLVLVLVSFVGATLEEDVHAEVSALRAEVERLRQERRLQDQSFEAEMVKKVADLRSVNADHYAVLKSIWILVCGTLCMLMHVGFAMVETGVCRARNASDVLIKNVLSVCVGSMGWWSVGWAFAFGELHSGFIGGTGFFGSDMLSSSNGRMTFTTSCTEGVCTSRMLHFFFQWVFCTTTVSIVSGGVAERIKTSTFTLYSFCMSGFIYPLVVAWTWGGGWLSTLWHVGFTDTAGSGVVHLTGGVSALVGAILLGPRDGRFEKTETFTVHNMPLVVLGTLFLWVGWFGFNAGSVAVVNGTSAALAAQAAFNTALAGAAGGITVTLVSLGLFGKYDVGGLCNGILSGCVSITAGCANMASPAALGVGAFSGLLYLITAQVLLGFHVDDPVNAFAVHGANGIWGCLAAVLFDWGGASFNGSGWGQGEDVKGTALAVACIYVVTLTAWAGSLSVIIFQSSRLLGVLRVNDKSEEKGIDAAEHAQATAYNLHESEGPNSWRMLWLE